MSAAVLRPVFAENQILGAADVNAIVSHASEARARHNAKLHSWGIADGLQLLAEEREDDQGKYMEVKLTAGMAVDGNGREIVVSADVRLSEQTFDALNVVEGNNDPDQHLYPVFIVARDRPQSVRSLDPRSCDERSSTRVEEGYEIGFDRVGSASELGQQAAGTSPFRILLGFVSWDGARFAGAADSDGNVSRRYVGARGEEMIGLGDTLALRSAERTQADKAALVISNEAGGKMAFGLHDDKGAIVPVFTVTARGDVIAQGRILGAIAGGVKIESGVVTDGMDVPLPDGITQEQIDRGEASIHVSVTPHYESPVSLAAPAGEYWLMQPIECRVDGRRVHCVVRWTRTDGGAGPFIMPGVCDYAVFGFVREE